MQLTRWLIISIGASLFLLTACGGGGDGDSNGVPSAATATDVISDTPPDDSTDSDANNAPSAATATDVISDTPPDDSTDSDGNGSSPFDLLSPLTGTWSGAWNNDTFGSTAPITIRIVVNGDGTASFGIDLPAVESGWPFDLIAVGPVAFEGTYDENGLSVSLRNHGFFGDMSVHISLEGNLVAEATMAVYSATGLTLQGSFDGDGMDITYTVMLPDGSEASGRATLTKS